MTIMIEEGYTYQTETKPVSNREEHRMRLYTETYLIWTKARSDGRALTDPKDASAAAVREFDDQFPWVPGQ